MQGIRRAPWGLRPLSAAQRAAGRRSQKVCSPWPGPRQLAALPRAPRSRAFIRTPGGVAALRRGSPVAGRPFPPAAFCRALCPLLPGPARVKPGGWSPPLPCRVVGGGAARSRLPPLGRPCPRHGPALALLALRAFGPPCRARSAGLRPRSSGRGVARRLRGAVPPFAAPGRSAPPPRPKVKVKVKVKVKGEKIHTCYAHAHICTF